MEDAGTIAAWAALAAALLALLVALAQATQQYVATAQSMRKCEASVWGPMPGHPGRRVWVWQQLRFRVVFDMPNIFIPAEHWHEQGNPREFAADRITILPAPFDPPPSVSIGTSRKKWKREAAATVADPEGTALVLHYSEAGWVSFARHVSCVCPASVRLGLTRGDVDRLPSDLTVVPMQVSLRDAIALGLAVGMTIVTVSNTALEMSGPSGVIKSSEHPLLGRLLHYTAYTMAPRSIKGLSTGEISRSWLRRLEGIATIAMQQYEEPKRRYYEGIGMRWRSNSQRLPQFRRAESDESEDEVVPQLTFTDISGESHTLSANECDTWEALVGVLEEKNIATAPYIIIGPENKPIPPKNWKALHRVVRQGDLNTNFKIKPGDYVATTPLVSRSPNAEPMKSKESDPSVLELQENSRHVTANNTTPIVNLEMQSPVLDAPRPEEPPRSPLTPGVTLESVALTANIQKGFDMTFKPPIDPVHGDGTSVSQQQSIPQLNVPQSSEHTTTQSPSARTPNEKAAQRGKPKKPYLALTWGAADAGSQSAQAPPPNPAEPQTRAPAAYARSVSSERSVSRATDSDDDYSYASPVREQRDYRYYVHPRSRRPPSPVYDSEQYWKRKQRSSYATRTSPWSYPEPPVLSFFWASQIDVELGSWANPWSGGLFEECSRALEYMVSIGLAGLTYTANQAVPKQKQGMSATNSTNPAVPASPDRPRVEAKEIRYVDFQDAAVLKDLWVHLREGKHTWPPYAVNSRRGFMTTSLSQSPEAIRFAAFGDHELLPPIVLLDSVRRSHLKLPSGTRGGGATSSVGSPTPVSASSSTAANLARDRLVELASMDCWLWRASEARGVAEGASGAAVVVNAAAIVEEVWLEFGQRIMAEWDEQGVQPHDRGDAGVRSLARAISKWLAGFLVSPAERYFVWVAFLRATKAMVCVDGGPKTGQVLDIFKADNLVFLL
ncbi:hypothetical protein SAMD00023353_10400240 [Rosellinia necatrix]|uniref:Uncharacterized protein n=1 Tax=Rosellinia necatrix TaxID=77044 RepID=A0A1W2TWN7_ROSNE|nr:hypothetical protein SAMD00023353_10400240 [Rosellinia necatrix]